MSTKPTVVIVDDHELFRAGVHAELEGLVDVRGEAGGVEEAVRLIEAERPDVVLLDVHMPGLDGFEVCRRLRRDRLFDDTTIVMLTAAAQRDDVARGLAAGADNYLTKPFSPVALLALFERLKPEAPLWMPGA